MHAAYDDLDRPRLKERLEDMTATHDFNKFWEKMRTRPGSTRPPLTPEQRAKRPAFGASGFPDAPDHRTQSALLQSRLRDSHQRARRSGKRRVLERAFRASASAEVPATSIPGTSATCSCGTTSARCTTRCPTTRRRAAADDALPGDGRRGSSIRRFCARRCRPRNVDRIGRPVGAVRTVERPVCCCLRKAGTARPVRPLRRGGRSPSYPMCNPPLSEKSAPVENPESSEASQATIEPISSGVPSRFTGIVPTILSSTSWRMERTISVPM